MISAEKQLLRVKVTESLRAMGETERAERSAKIAGHLSCLTGVVFGFAPMRLEPNWTHAIGAEWKMALPRIEGHELRFHRACDLAGGEIVPPSEADVVLTPGVAFDRGGARLGRGGGFYDRMFANTALIARRVAVCFACQVVERVPVEPHDQEVDAIVTEDGWIEMRSSGRGRDGGECLRARRRVRRR